MNIKNNWIGAYQPNQAKVAIENTKLNKTDASTFRSLVAAREGKAEQANNNNKRVDKIELSSNAPTTSGTLDLAKLKEKIMSDITNDVDARKVEAIKNQINANNYKIDPTELAYIIIQG